MKAVAYCRKSTSGVGENGVERQEGSFARQRTAIEDYAERKGFTIVKWYEDEASGKTLSKRKDFLQMVKDARAGKFKIALFGEYDRFMRNVLEAWRYELEFRDAGVKLHFSNLRNDGSDQEEMYKDMFRRMAASFSKQLAEKCIQGMIRKAHMGSWLGGVPPYGYRTQKNPDGKILLVVHEPEAEVVREMFSLSLKGWGHMRIAEFLNEKGIPSSEAARIRNSRMNQNPDGKWSGGTVRMVLRNPIYAGTFRWNRTERSDCFDWKLEGKGTVEIGEIRRDLDRFKGAESSIYCDRKKDKAEWIVKEGAAPAIVPAEIFESVQARFKQYVSRNWNRGNNMKYLMAKGLKCANCGNFCSGHRYGKVLKTSGEKVFYEFYRCGGAMKKGTHGRGGRTALIRMPAIDDKVVNGILSRAKRFMDPVRVKELFKNRIQRFMDERPSRLPKAKEELERAEKEIVRTIEAYAKFGVSIPEDKRLELMDRKRRLEDEISALLAAGESYPALDINREAEEFIAGIKNAPEILEAGHPMDRIRLREKFLKSAEIKWLAGKPSPEVKFTWYRVPMSCSLRSEGPPPPILMSLVSITPEVFCFRGFLFSTLV